MEVIKSVSVRNPLWFAMAWDDWVLISATAPQRTEIGEPIHNHDNPLQFEMKIEAFARQFGFELPHGRIVLVELPLGKQHGEQYQFLPGSRDPEPIGPFEQLPAEEEGSPAQGGNPPASEAA